MGQRSDNSLSDPLDSLVDVAAQVLNVPLDPAWRAAVKANLKVILNQAELFADFSLPDEAEPAPIFTA